jgi:signal transduction histidine kinase
MKMVTKEIYFDQDMASVVNKKRDETPIDTEYADMIISSIAHELSTSVAVISSNIQLFRRFRYDINPAVREESFTFCEDSVKDISHFLDNIQLLNSVRKSRIYLEPSSVDLKKLVRHLYLELAKMNWDHKRIFRKWNLKDRNILCDKNMLFKILFNVVGNALKFSKGSVQLNISASNHELLVMVRDFGIGIPEEQIEMVFQPFYRASNVGHIPGLGLGLSIVYSLVKKLNGRILLSSSVGEGMIIQIIIPYELPIQNSGH